MSDTQAPSSGGIPKGSLWTTPASESESLIAFKRPLVDTNVTAENIRDAVYAVKERAAAFSGRVSDEALRTSVE